MKRREFLRAAIVAATTTTIPLTLLSKEGEVSLLLQHADIFDFRELRTGDLLTTAHMLFREPDSMGGDTKWIECTTTAGKDAMRELVSGFDIYLTRKYGASYGFRKTSPVRGF